MTVDDARSALARDAVLIDLRSPAAHSMAHVPGSVSIPSGSSFGTWLGWVVEPDRPLILMLDSPADWDDAARQAMRVGYENLLGHIRGGFANWTESGAPVEAGGRLTVDQLAARLDRGGSDAPLVVDVRQVTEYVSGHVPAALHVGAGSLQDRLQDLPRDRPIATICASGYRSSVAASLLRAAGFNDVSWVADGLPAWRAHGHPVERGEGETAGTTPSEPDAHAATAGHRHPA
jgi:hydroxyacylglutathione hydrolase